MKKQSLEDLMKGYIAKKKRYDALLQQTVKAYQECNAAWNVLIDQAMMEDTKTALLLIHQIPSFF